MAGRETVRWSCLAFRVLMGLALGSAAVVGVAASAAAAGSFSINLPIGDGWMYQHEGVNYLMPTPERRSDFYLEGAASSLEEQDFPVQIDVEATLLDGSEATLCAVDYADTGTTHLDWRCDLADAPGPIPSASAVWATLHTHDGEEITAWLDDTMILASPTFARGTFPSRDGVVTVAGTKLASMGVEVYEGLLDGVADPEQEPLCTDLTSRSSTWSCDAAVVVDGSEPTFVSARMVPVPGVSNPFGVPSEYRWWDLQVEVIDGADPEPEPEPDPEPEPEPEPEPDAEVEPEPDAEVEPEPGAEPEPEPNPMPDATPTAEPDPMPEPHHQPGPEPAAADTNRPAVPGPGTGARDEADDESASPPAPAQDDLPSTTTEPATADERRTTDDVSVTSDRADPTEYGHSLRTVGDLVEVPGGVLVAAVAAAFGFLLLVAIPAELLYGTLRSNYARVFVVPTTWRRWWDRVVGRLQGRAWRLLAAPAMVVGGAAIATFAEPDPSGPGVWLRVFLAMLLAVTAMNATAVVVGRSYAGREHLPAKVRLMPGFLLIAVASVVASRLADVQPGVLFGLLAMTAVTVPMSAEQSGKLAGAVCGAFVGVGLTAWLLYSLIATDAHGFGVELLREALTTVTIGGIGSIVVALLPLTFLSGHDLIRWSRPAWAALYGGTLVLFCLIVLPMPESWAEADGVGIVWAGLFGAFGLVSIATWAWFRFRAAPERSQDLAGA